MKKLLTMLLIFVQSTLAYSYVDCVRPVKNIWTGHDDNKVYIIHGDGHANSRLALDFVNGDEKIIDRVLSVIMAGTLSGKSVSFRYTETINGSSPSCAPVAQQKMIGAWINF